MRQGTRLALRSLTVITVAAVAATLLVAPAQADDALISVSAPGAEVSRETTSAQHGVAANPGQLERAPGPDRKEVRVTVHELSPGTFLITDLATDETTVVNSDGSVATGEEQAPAPTSSHHLVSRCGFDWGRPYCDFTRTAQGMAVVGSFAAITVAICAATGTLLCAAAAAAAAALGYYITQHGLCPGDARVRYQGYFHVFCR